MSATDDVIAATGAVSREPGATTFEAVWRAAVATNPAAVFLRFEASTGSVTEWTYEQFDGVVTDVAASLSAHGVDADRGVHLALTNSPAFVAVWLAASRLGSWIIPSDPMATAPELAEHLARTRPAVSVVSVRRRDVADAATAERIDDVIVSSLGVHTIAVDEDDVSLGALRDPVSPPDDATGSGAHTPLPAPTDRLAVMFTSGTTGRPKGVVITQANYAFAGATMAAAAGLSSAHRQLVVLPLFHANAQYYSFASAISVGASVALMHTFSASGFLRQCVDHDVTDASLFAGPMRMILARATPDPARPVRLRHCWFAQNLTADQYEQLSAWLGVAPRQLYGMTETIPAVLSDRATTPRPDALGTPSPNCRVELHDEQGHPTPPGDVGEVVVGGTPGHTLFAEYLDDPETTSASFRGAWFRTGDRARVGADGRFEFDGRRSDVLKVSGENVSVVEVEAAVASHPDVFDVVVVGAPDPVRDEVPVAFVVPVGNRDHESLVGDLHAWAEQRLGKAKRPRAFTVVDELPRTSVGKVRKFLLSESASKHADDKLETRTVS